MNKIVPSPDEAVADLRDGASVAIGGFGDVGVPFALIAALLRKGVGNLTLISNNCGTGERGISQLFKHGLVRRVYASFPSQPGNDHFLAAFRSGQVELELVPQGTLVERLRAAGAGIAAFFTPTGVATELAAKKESRTFDGRPHLLELALRADVALVHAHRADSYGNLRYRRSSRNFNAVMAMAGRLTIAEAEAVVAVGAIDPDDVHTAGVFVDRVVPTTGGPYGLEQ